MKRRIILGVVTALLLVIGIVIIVHWSSPRKPMPVYQGKTAEQWLAEIFTTNQTAAMAAFREMGTNTYPVLIDVFTRKETIWSKAYGAIYRKLPAAWQKHLAPPVRPQDLWGAAHLVLINDQTRARRLLPELARILEDKSIGSHSFVLSVVVSLVRSGDNQCLPSLVSCMTDNDPMGRFEAIQALGQIGPSAEVAVQPLIRELADTNAELRVSAAWALWNINHDTNHVVSVLREALNSKKTRRIRPWVFYDAKHWALVYLCLINPNDVSLIPALIDQLEGYGNDSRDAAIMFLGNYGKGASAAVPTLTNFLDPRFRESRDLELRKRVLDTLEKIDPDTAAKYESK